LGHEKAARLHADKVMEKKPDFTLSDFAKQLPYRSETDCTTFLEGLRCAGLPD
jgi:hypothetical protein